MRLVVWLGHGHAHREAPNAWRRFVAYMVQAFSSDASGLLPDPPSEEQLTRSLIDNKDRA